YQLFAATVMPDHAHILFQPSVKETDAEGKTVFWSLGELMHSIKSFTAKEINRLETKSGSVWEQERFDRYARGDRDLAEKFRYIVENPWRAGLVSPQEEYRWVWTQDDIVSGETPATAGETPTLPETGAMQRPEQSDGRSATNDLRKRIPGSFAFKLYDTYGFPLDLTELMARERGLTVDVTEFEKLMDEQRARARKAQKKETITIEDQSLDVGGTKFLGFDFIETEAVVERIVPGKEQGQLNVILDRTTCYAEMGGQVGDHGLLHVPGHDRTEIGRLKIVDTQKRGEVVVHRAQLIDGRAPEPGEAVRIAVDADRRQAIQRHHTVTHILHWALHELVSRDATQKGSYVGPDKLTFDFSSSALSKPQVRDLEKLVNEKISEKAAVSWTEIPYAEAKQRADIQQFFGDKYGDTVRVVQIGGDSQRLNGYSMELCGGTHVRNTGDIEWFHIVREEAIAAGIRRIEALAGPVMSDWAVREAKKQQEKFEALERKKSGLTNLPNFDAKAAPPKLLQQIEQRAAQLEKLEAEIREWKKGQAKQAEANLQSRAATIATELAGQSSGQTGCVAQIPDADGKLLGAVADALKSRFAGPTFLVGAANGRVSLVAVVPKDMTSKIQANKLIQEIAPIVGGKGGGRPDSAQGGGTDPERIGEALKRARELLLERGF
ncbi:MAG TPA: alanine--tRNA ligase-related protein, partial [Chthoniobacterales bacterium]|nr:alanine--tRNA ligase-related protein [Chthoniobacterales bacterium]